MFLLAQFKLLKIPNHAIGEIARFFSYSPKSQRLLDKAIDLGVDSLPKATKLKDACRTRIQRIASYATILKLHEVVYTSLEAIVHPSLHVGLGNDWSWDRETVTKANSFLFQLQSSTFLVALHILLQVMQLLKELHTEAANGGS